MIHTLRPPDKKCLLSIDGGGIRGVMSLQILKRIELIAERISGNPTICLSECFDYIGGTSTGGILAAGLACGMRVSELESFYLDQAVNMFTPNTHWFKRYTSAKYDSGALQTKLQEVFGATTTLGSSKLRSLLMLVMLNASTSSPWPISSNPNALYNDLDTCGTKSNLHLPLWQLVRASAAAPFFFEPEAIIIEGKQYLFYDGALTSYNNPAFKLFQMATLPQYRLEWPVGSEKMLMVSVGSGLLSRSIGLKDPKSVSFLESLPTAIQSMMFTGTTEQDLLCRSFSDVRAGDPIDSEVGPLLGSSSIGGQPLFSYVRYNADLSPNALRTNGLESLANVSFSIDSLDAIQPCIEVGKQVAESRVLESHFAGFWTYEN